MNNINKYLPKTATFPLLTITIVVYVFQAIFNMLNITFTEALYLMPTDIFTRPWILITSMFLHGSLSHLFFNMYALLIFGPVLESRVGRNRFFGIYFISGIISAFGYALFSIEPALGASGAIMGILGATIILIPNLPVLFFFIVPMSLRTAGIIFALIDIVGIFNPTSNIAHLAHIFGLGAGLIYGSYLIKKRKKFQTSFNTLKKYSEPIKNTKLKKSKQNIHDYQYNYSSSIQLDDEDVDNYLKNGRL